MQGFCHNAVLLDRNSNIPSFCPDMEASENQLYKIINIGTLLFRVRLDVHQGEIFQLDNIIISFCIEKIRTFIFFYHGMLCKLFMDLCFCYIPYDSLK